MKDIKPLLLLLLSIGLVGTWVFHFYDKASYSKISTDIAVKDSVALANAIKDSLAKTYSSAISNLDAQLDSSKTHADSLRISLDTKLQEINKLKTEISGILGKPSVSKNELSTAKEKIALLQEKVGELETQNTSIEEEKKQLNVVLGQLTQNVDNLEQNIRKITSENEALTEKINLASTFVASNVHLAAVNMKADKEQETNQLKKADKFVISFALQNHSNQYDNAEVAIVIIQPDNQVLQNSKWDSGLFDTKSEGKKNFTRMVRFDYNKGEQKNLSFSLDADQFQKGNYQLQVWHKGIMIGKAYTGLN